MNHFYINFAIVFVDTKQCLFHINMYKRFLFLLLCMSACACGMCARTVVADATDRSPLAAASVFDSSGTMVALTDSCGVFDTALPVAVRCLGYEPARLEAQADTLFMTPASFELPEMTFNLAEREVLRLICYVREYLGMTTSRDTTAVFAEYMVDYMLPVKKLKKYKGRATPRILGRRCVARIAMPGGGNDSISVNPDEMTELWLQLAGMHGGKDGEYKNFPDSILHADGEYAEPGKYGPRVVYRVQPEVISVAADGLADRKNHRWSPWIFKLIGCTIDFSDMCISRAYNRTPKGSTRPEELLMSTISMKAVGRGKFLRKALDSKTPVSVNCFFEVYPVDREYLTVLEAKASDSDSPAETEIMVPAHAMPLDAATERLLERASEIRR